MSSLSIKSFLSELLRCTLQIVWPVACPICGRLSVVCCDECVTKALDPVAPFCLECGTSIPCARHKDAPVVYAGSIYAGDNRELVHALKYRGKRAIGTMMGRTLGSVFHIGGVDALVPVPLHADSMRGYNQSAEIARGLSTEWGVPVTEPLAWRRRVTRQAIRGSHDRTLPGDAMFSRRLGGTRVVLVDDVFTSGNTMRAAASAIAASGGSVAGAIVWSRRI